MPNDNSRINALEKRIKKAQLEIAEIRHRQYLERDAAQCDFGKGSNTRCYLPKDHQFVHRIPCVDHGAHGVHHDVYDTYEILCSGRAFDLT